MKIAVSGASGFIGTEVCRLLAERSQELVRIRGLRDCGADPDSVRQLQEQLDGVAAVIHLAARAHVMEESSANALSEFRRANVTATMALARAAALAGVGRFVFVSSIGVLGNESGPDIFCEASPPAPVDPYAISKLEAEAALGELCFREKMTLSIVRPPLVYGPRAPGNFARLLRLVHSGLPLPFGGFCNLRSFIGVTNLASLLLLCSRADSAANQVFVAADGEDISLPDLLQRLARMMRKPARLISVPPLLLRVGAKALGRGADLNKLMASLRVDASKCRAVLGWSPTKTLDAGLEDMVAEYELRSGRDAR